MKRWLMGPYKRLLENQGRTTTVNRLCFFWALLGLAGAFIFLQALRFNEPLGLDQGIFALGGHAMHKGMWLYRDIWDPKPPGVFGLYSLAFLLLGGTVKALWIFEAVWLALTAALLFLMARQLWSTWSGLITAFVFITAVWAPEWGGYWSRAQADEFLLLPLMGTFWASWLAGKRSRFAFLAGLLLGVCGCIKIPTFLFGAALPWCWLGSSSPIKVRGLAMRLLLVALGVVAAWLPVILLFGSQGLLHALWEATIVFNSNFSEVVRSQASLNDTFIRFLQICAHAMPTALVCALAGFVSMALSKQKSRLVLVGTWCLVAIVIVLLEYQLAGYHFLIMIPAVALAAGYGLYQLFTILQNKSLARRLLGAAGILVVLATAVYDITHWAHQYDADFRYLFGKIDQKTHLQSFSRGIFDPAMEIQSAKTIRRLTRPDQKILIWGLAPGIYFLADRKPITRYVFHHLLLTEEQLSIRLEGLKERQAEFLKRLTSDPPALVLVGTDDQNGFEAYDSYTQMLRFPAFHRIISEQYTPVGKVGTFLFYLRNP